MKTRIVHSADVINCMRFDGSYHNAEVNIYDDVIKHHSSHPLSFYCTEIFTSGRNKRVYTTKEYGYPFLSNSDVVSANPFLSCKYSSKKYGYDEKAVLKKGMILTGRVGAIGQTAFVPEYLEKENAMGSDNIIRICVKPEYKNGFIYAYLASRIGSLSFWKHATGGVQPFITDVMVGTLPIPDFPASFQKEVDDLIQESARLREEAHFALKEAHHIIENNIDIPVFSPSHSTSIKNICRSHTTRLEGFYYSSENRHFYNEITSRYDCKPLKDYTEKIFRPGIFKREYVDNGVMFLGGADIMRSIPRSEKQLSFRQVKNMPELKVEKGWILVTCGGTIGNTVYIDNQLAQCVVSQHVMRIVPRKDISSGFLYAFLSSEIGYRLITMFTYGAVIPSLEPHHLELVPIPTLNREAIERADELVSEYARKLEIAKEKELKAIAMVEQEIEKWN